MDEQRGCGANKGDAKKEYRMAKEVTVGFGGNEERRAKIMSTRL